MELEQQAFVVAMGIDQAPHGLKDYSFLIAMPVSQTSGGGDSGGKQPKAGSGPVTFRAHSVAEAMQLANSSVERSLTLSHLSLILFGESLAKSGLTSELRPMVRFREFRRTTFLGVSQGTARGILAQNSPMLEKSSSRWADDIAEVSERSSLTFPAHLHDFLRSLEDVHEDPAVPLCAINEGVASDPQGQSAAVGQLTYQAGKISRIGGNPVEWAGAAVFRKDRMVDELSGRQVMDLRMLQGALRRAKYEFPASSDESQSVSLRIHRERTPRYHVQLTNPVRVTVDVPVEADLISTEDGTDYTETAQRLRLERQVAGQLSKELTQLETHLAHDDHVDVVPVSRHIRGLFATHAAFAQFPWQTRLATANIRVQVKLHVRRFGIQAKPVQPQ